MKIQSISSQNFKSVFERQFIYYDLPYGVYQFESLPQGQQRAFIELESTMRGSGLIGSYVPRAELHEKGWDILTAPSDKYNAIDVAMVKNAKLSKENIESEIFHRKLQKNNFKYDAAIILGQFYSKSWLSSYDLMNLKKFKNVFSLDTLLDKIKQGIEFAEKNLDKNTKGIFKI